MSVTAKIQKEHFATVITTNEHQIIADEQLTSGGGGKGMAPKELLAASLASCAAITMRMYADRKQWLVNEIIVTVDIEQREEETIFLKNIKFVGTLDTVQVNRLLDIANHCPVHKILSSTIQIKTPVV
jgi:putative redox protein